MDAKQLALLISELIDDDVHVLDLPRGDSSMMDIVVDSPDGQKTFLISVMDLTKVIKEFGQIK